MQGLFQHLLNNLPAFAIIVGLIVIAAWLAWQLRRERQWRRQESTDALTGLPSRRVAAAEAEQTIENARQRGEQFAVIVLNIDRLKSINNSLGYQAGDEVLHAITRRLRTALSPNHLLARLVGNEFAIIVRDIRGTDDAEAIAHSMLSTMREPFSVASVKLHVSLTVGVSMFPRDGESFDVLLRRAETALRCAKSNSRGSHCFYAVEMSTAAEERLALENDL